MAEPPNPLTSREAEVLQLLANGYTAHQIAIRWGIAPGTVHNHLRLIHARLGVPKTEQAVILALRHGWIA
ncbi:MAG: hypothetical protein CMJ84_00075 [Planctomycetes bacterium]|jgi:two-component system response regulator DesR|nr:hypothetical protein [Planctomycetota bacterium]